VSSGYLDLPPEALPLASIGQRAVARVVDTVLVAIPGALLLVPFVDTSGEQVSIAPPFWATVAVIALFALYEIVCIASWGQTVGMRLFKIRVVRIDDGLRAGWSKSAIRALVPLAASAVPLLGPFLCQGVHDKAAGTLVIHALRADPAAG
jgi:uncharacterized RDD family membrane protein YckC